MFLQKSSLVDVWLVSKYVSGFRNSHRHSVEKAALKNFAIFTGKHLYWSLFLTKLQALFPHSDWIQVSLRISIFLYSVWMQGKNWKKNLQLIPFFMALATYCYYERVCRMIHTTFVLYLLNTCTFIIKSNWKHFQSSRMAPKH